MKKVVLVIAFIFILLSISQVSAGYNSAKSNIIANKIHECVLDDDVGNLLKEVKKAEPRETSRIPGKGLNAVNVKLAKEIQVNVSISVNHLLKEVKKAEPREVARDILSGTTHFNRGGATHTDSWKGERVVEIKVPC